MTFRQACILLVALCVVAVFATMGFLAFVHGSPGSLMFAGFCAIAIYETYRALVG